MAIALDTSSSGSTSSWSHTVTGSNTLLIVGVLGDLTDTLSSITYNGVSMTLVGKVQTLADRWNYMYYLLNPTTGTNTISVSGPSFVNGASVSYTGVKQSGQPDASTTNNATAASSITTTITVIAANSWAVLWAATGSGNLSASTGSTQRQLVASEYLLADSNAALSTGSNSMTANDSPSGNLSTIMASFAPIPSAVISTIIPTLSFLGAG